MRLLTLVSFLIGGLICCLEPDYQFTAWLALGVLMIGCFAAICSSDSSLEKEAI